MLVHLFFQFQIMHSFFKQRLGNLEGEVWFKFQPWHGGLKLIITFLIVKWSSPHRVILNSQAHVPQPGWAQPLNLTLTLAGVILNTVEFCCYIIFFAHIIHHDNFVAVMIVKKEVVRQRNRNTAISMVGLFATWVLEMAYNIWLALFVWLGYSQQLRELLTIIKMAEFVIMPIIEVLTSPPLRKFVFKK